LTNLEHTHCCIAQDIQEVHNDRSVVNDKHPEEDRHDTEDDRQIGEKFHQCIAVILVAQTLACQYNFVSLMLRNSRNIPLLINLNLVVNF